MNPHLIVDNFLNPIEHSKLLAYALEKQDYFVESMASTGHTPLRQSKVLYSFEPLSTLFDLKIRLMLSVVCSVLDIPTFTVSEVECQLTAHNHGDYFDAHRDDSDSQTKARMVSYAYYLFNEPQRFVGGELILHNTGSDIKYAPKNNAILFFPSGVCHQVLPVHCPSRRFGDSRFTVNGWVRSVM
jgi:SM-20-related protein